LKHDQHRCLGYPQPQLGELFGEYAHQELRGTPKIVADQSIEILQEFRPPWSKSNPCGGRNNPPLKGTMSTLRPLASAMTRMFGAPNAAIAADIG
jgi:hypothetical protein